MSVIYFAQFIEVENSPIKIGYSEDVDRRLGQLEWNYREPLALLATMPGGRDVERAIHVRFSHLRMGTTEQFRPAPELMEFIGRPILVGTNPDAVEVVPSQVKPMVAQLRGSAEWKAWIEKVAAFDDRAVASLFERSVHRYAKEIGFPEEPPER